jgi:hypothetical protein
LKAGATAVFSEECAKLLAKAGYKPDWFGSYSHVKDVIKEAKARVAQYAADVKAGKAMPNDPAMADDLYLANCQGGHLVQNAVFQTERNNPCKNVPGMPGFDEEWCPAMPQAGQATQDGGEHNFVSLLEQKAARNAGEVGSPYPGSAIERDCRLRANALANNRELAAANGRRATGVPGLEGGGAGGGGSSGGPAGGAAGPTGAKPNAPGASWRAPVQGNTPGDCIENFRQAGMQAMQDRCAQNRAANRAMANGGAGNSAEQGKIFRQELDDAAEKARAAAAADPKNAELKKRAALTQADATAARNALCRADQGDAIFNGNRGSGSGIVPPNPDYRSLPAILA